MQLHQLSPQRKNRRKKRVGRGGKRGTYSGRGMKGQKARAGHRFQPIIRGLIKRYPKLRGYKFKSKTKNQKPKIATINLGSLEKKFSAGDKITPEVLVQKRIIRRIKGRIPIVKILGGGELTRVLTIEGCLVSEGARRKIEKAGGRVQ